LIRDPQGLAESVLKRVQKTGSSFRFQFKLLAINFVTRLVGNHELLLLPLYPFLRRYMGGQQRDVTQILAYTVQACHDTVPPEEIHGILKTIAHNFITERCTGEQMAVGINACRAICARSPSSLLPEDSNTLNDDEANDIGSSSISVDVEAFARDLAGYAKHRDRSVAVAGRSWTNFVREVHPSLLQGKDRGTTGSALHRAGEKPLRYGEQRVASGVAGADLLVEYESKKAAHLKKQMASGSKCVESEGEDEDEGEDSGDWVDIDDDEGEVEDDDGWVEMDDTNEEEEEDDDLIENDYESEDNSGCEDEDEIEQAPTLVPVTIIDGKPVPLENPESVNEDKTVDLASMTPEQRAKFNEEISSSRVFTAADFEKMRKLVEREERLKRDPRAAARMKRRRAQGKEFEELSDDESEADSDDDEGRVQVKGAVNANDIMADAKRKRANKMERLEKIIAGREQFEHKQRAGGSTNTEKKRKQNFLMSKFSTKNRSKQSSKETARRGILQKTKKNKQFKHENKKRRRKL
jgi:protein SDA1